MTRKLTLVFVVGMTALILFLIYSNITEKESEKLDISSFPEGDFYGSIETTEVIRIIRAIHDDSLVDSFPFSLTVLDGFLNTLKESGLDPSTVYVVINSIKSSITLLLPVHDSKSAKEHLNEYAYLFDFQSDTINNALVFSYDKLTFSIDEKWLQLNYTDSLFFQDFEIPVPTSVHRLDPSVFEETNQFQYSSSITDSLGVEKLLLTQAESEKGFQWLVQIKAKDVFPFEFSTDPFQSHTFGSSKQRISFSTKPIDKGVAHPFRKKLTRLFKDYGLNEQNIFAHWNGGLTLEMGPLIEHVDTIITTSFDEEFNPLEEHRVRKKMRPSYLLFLGSEKPEGLVKALNKNNFFQTRNGITRLPNGGLTNTSLFENGVLFTTMNAQTTTPIKSTENIINFSWNELVVQLNLEKSSAKEVAFLFKVILPSQAEVQNVEK
jgi:D-ribose pyranose/furanose isomerase RbsD